MKELSLHITDVCNFRCRFCLFDDLSHDGERISWNELHDFLDFHRGQSYERINLHGGEPTLRSDLFQLLALIRSMGYPTVSIQTNGWLLTNRDFVRRLVDEGISLFVISVHGDDAVMHDKLVGAPGSYNRLLPGIENVLSLNQDVRTNTVIVRQNYRSLPQIAGRILEFGVRQVNLSSLMPSGNANKNVDDLMPTYSEIAPFVDQAVKFILRNNAKVHLEGFPLCSVPGNEDACLWRLPENGQVIKCIVRGNIINNHDSFVSEHCRVKSDMCRSCAYHNRCPGVYEKYVHHNGWGEFQPISIAAIQ
jgi:MoaA/NifB/PqqE/SkfB family radical SAM enzyme